MELRVTDNGPGIPPERLAMLQADLARGLSVSGEGTAFSTSTNVSGCILAQSTD